MLTAFKGETGGTFDIPFTHAGITTGFATIIGQQHTNVRAVGIVLSGVLSIRKRDISELPLGDYTFLPQVVDAAGFVYFLPSHTLSVIGRS